MFHPSNGWNGATDGPFYPFERRQNVFNRVILAAGVAALAISAPASAKPDREHGGQSAQTQRAERPQRAQRVERQARVERAPRTERVQREARVERAPRVDRQQRMAQAERPARAERQQRVERQQVARNENVRVERQRAERVNRVADRQEVRDNRVERQQVRVADRQDIRNQRREEAQNRVVDRRALHAERVDNRLANNGVGYGVGGCPPGLADKGCVPPGQQRSLQNWARLDDRRATRQALAATRLAALDNRIATQFVEPVRVRTFIGSPVNTVSAYTPLLAMPSTISYLYPDTSDYYYRYGGGYVYRVDRSDNLISWVLPLLAGGFMPGQYLPSSYMNSYMPNYYGFNSFYPSSYADYGYGGYGGGYGYNNLCNRYANGVVYQVDCVTGLVQDVVPIYAGGYGVGQMLPSSYGYYNVPYQYRDMYYNTPDYNYWYAPGAIYQVDPATSMISSVAALLTPGFSVGQPLPAGYNMYNVPLAYRSTYYDTPNAWYRYNNGYIYQVDPTTQLVTAIVASILT